MTRITTLLFAGCAILLLFSFARQRRGSFPVMHRYAEEGHPADSIAILQVNPDEGYQTIHSFGASDCWSAKFVGSWRNEAKKNHIADLLFSTKLLPDGSPAGIGLSLWRFNIGAGSLEQGKASTIADEYRREECFLQPDGHYDWNREKGNQWFLRAAKIRGVKYLLGFANSAPVQFTQNGLAAGLARNELSCRPDKYADYAGFLTTVAEHFKKEGLPLDYISPVNEPQWKWGEHANQEGSGATNAQISTLARLIGSQLARAKLAAQVTVAEAAQVQFLYNSNNSMGNQIADFFSPASANYLGNVPNIAPVLAYHSYFSTCPDSVLQHTRMSAFRQRQSVDSNLQLWQSEFGILGNICGLLNGGPRHTGIDYGLYVATVMHADLTVAGVTSFQWWLGINPYDYSDGLVYINAPDGSISPQQSREDGRVSDSKQLWCMGNYARFVRPGMQRIAASVNTDGLLVSAYVDKAKKTITVVLVNPAETIAKVQVQPGNRVFAGPSDLYTTSATENLAHAVSTTNLLVLRGKTVTTLVAHYR